MPTDLMTRRSAEPRSGLNPDVMDGERLGELTPRAEPKDAKDGESCGWQAAECKDNACIWEMQEG